MKSINDLWLGYRDAENYKRKENKNKFNKIFLRTQELEELNNQDIYFLIGEKGTGKTAYSVFYSNIEYKNNVASLRYIRETEYKKFVQMKKTKKLTLSDYTNIWKVIIYLLISQQIREKLSNKPIIGKFWDKFNNLSKAIDEYYQNAFSPEIIYAINFAEEASIAAEILSKHASLGAGEKTQVSFAESKYQVNLFYLQKQFEEALSNLKLKHNYLLFIDGIDIRPSGIPYDDYLSCIKGLANAIWSINSDFFANIKDSKGRLRVVLLLRPDIFNSLGLQNQNSKVRDNSVILNWQTTYPDYRNSSIFELSDRILRYQQNETLEPGKAWDFYYPYDSRNVHADLSSPTSFVTFLRYSLYRPRDILTIMSIQKENYLENNEGNQMHFTLDDFYDPAFTRKYSDYVLGEVKDQIAFYYSSDDYELFIKFFQYLNGQSRFTYDEYINSYQAYIKFIENNSIQKPAFCTTPDNFLQFLYELNVIGFIVDTKDEPFFGWCYRERSPSNIAPKVRQNVRYQVHYGLMKALDLGKKYL